MDRSASLILNHDGGAELHEAFEACASSLERDTNPDAGVPYLAANLAAVLLERQASQSVTTARQSAAWDLVSEIVYETREIVSQHATVPGIYAALLDERGSYSVTVWPSVAHGLAACLAGFVVDEEENAQYVAAEPA